MTSANDLSTRVENLETDSLNLRLMAGALLAAVEAHQRESNQRAEQHTEHMARLDALAVNQQQQIQNLEQRISQNEARINQNEARINQHEQRMNEMRETAQDIREILQMLTRRFSGEG
jgi:septal ring factor EnvC (AmiA/AmiB activator)